MSSSGAKTKSLFWFLCIFSYSLLADDFGQYLLGMTPEPLEEASNSEEGKKSKKSPFLPDASGLPESYKNVQVEGDNFLFPGKNEIERAVSERESINDTGYTLPGSYDKSQTLVTPVNSEIYTRIKDQGTESYSFNYLYDNYDVSNGRNTFDKTFNNGPDSLKSGFFHMSYDRFLWGGGRLKTGYNAGIGVGYAQGYGVFSSSRSQTRIKFFMIPIDFGLSMSAFNSDRYSLIFAGGASAMILSQNRDDREVGDSDKDVRQISPGYYALAKFKYSLNALYPERSFEMFKSYSVTNSYLTLDLRYNSYSSFADTLTISGASFGLGLSFDYY